MSRCRTIPIELVCSVPHIDLTVNGGTAVTLTADTAIEIHPSTDPVPIWDGATTFTPTEETQTVAVQGYEFIENITINPIPSNYGRITKMGNRLLIS